MKNSIPLGFIRIFILLICLTSCGSKKQQKVALPADFKGPMGYVSHRKIIYSCTTRGPVGWVYVINWEGARSGAWIAPVSYRSFIGRYTENSWLVPRRICWSIIARKWVVPNCRKEIWYFLRRVVAGNVAFRITWGFTWKMGASSIPVLPVAWW